MIFPRPFRDPTKRGIVRACDDHCDIAAAKRLEHLAGFPWVQILMNVFSDSQVCNFLSTSRIPFNYNGMNGRIEELFQRLEHLAEQRNRLGLREGIGRKVSQRTPTTYVVEEGFCPYGRDKDKEKLKTLSDNESSSNFSVVPIVGIFPS
nr:putative disease resistance RPP13-like protein 1 isoform X1 [Malus domestica]